MSRKSVKLSAPVADPPKPIVDPPKPVVPAPTPKTEVHAEGKWSDDGKTTNELVVQRVSVPFTYRSKTEFKEYVRIFVRPDELHDDPDARWDDHEPEDEAALKQLFATYGKGSGTEIAIRLNVDGAGKEEFFLDVRHPKAEPDDDDAKCPSVLIDPKSSIGDVVLDLFYEMGNEDPPADFVTRGALEDLIEEQKADMKELEPVESLLREFDMPGDHPAYASYGIAYRLRRIFRVAKGMTP